MQRLSELKSRDAVLQAIAEYDRLGKDKFLSKYGFGPAKSFFLHYEGKPYDSKAIAGAAYGFEHPNEGPLTARDFSGGDATVRPKLESLGFKVVSNEEIDSADFTSDRLTEGAIYSREDLIQMFNIVDSTVKTGVFRPKGSRSIWLFVTRDKTSDRTQYEDLLDGDLLHWEGQTSGRTDAKIVGHEANGDELLVFYRNTKRQHPKAGFRFEGQFRYLSHTPGNPSKFLLQRVREQLESRQAQDFETFDPTDIEDGRRRVLAAASRRQGQTKFRRELMRAYEGKCAVTGCTIEPLLEAAHIHPYLGPHTNHVTNGMLLRADIHTLFDLGLLSVDADHRVLGSEILLNGDYAALIGQSLELPSNASDRPSSKALEWHREHRYAVR